MTVAIVGLLAALISPLLGTAQDSARNAGCVKNLKTIASVLHIYASDNDGYLPMASRSDTDRWSRDLREYLPVRQVESSSQWENEVFVCPSATNGIGQKGSQLRISYFASAALCGPDATGELGMRKNTARKQASITSPSRTPLLFEGKMLGNANNAGYCLYWSVVAADIGVPAESTRYASYLHGGRMNVIMTDGSLQGWSPDDFARLESTRYRGIDQ